MTEVVKRTKEMYPNLTNRLPREDDALVAEIYEDYGLTAVERAAIILGDRFSEDYRGYKLDRYVANVEKIVDAAMDHFDVVCDRLGWTLRPTDDNVGKMLLDLKVTPTEFEDIKAILGDRMTKGMTGDPYDEEYRLDAEPTTFLHMVMAAYCVKSTKLN